MKIIGICNYFQSLKLQRNRTIEILVPWYCQVSQFVKFKEISSDFVF